MSGFGYYAKPTSFAAPSGSVAVGGVCVSTNNGNGNAGSANDRERVTRILVVGETRVGKTLLIRRLCDQIFGDTAIETSTEEYSAFNSSATAEGAADEDNLGPEWGPTVGIAIDALKRSTTVLCNVPHASELSMPALFPPTPIANGIAASSSSFNHPPDHNSYGGYPSVYGTVPTTGGGGGGLQYRGTSAAVSVPGGGDSNNTFSSSTSNPPPSQLMSHPTPLQQRCTVRQTVEFHELGGSHGYRDIARLPLRNIRYDGVIFVYHRRDLTSTVYLSDWYDWVCNVLSTSASVSGPGNPHNSSNRFKTMPRFMLVGTQLVGDELTAAAAGVRKDVDSTLHIGTVAVSDEALLDGNFEVKVRVLQSPQTPASRSRVKRVGRTVVRSVAWPYHVFWCLWHPFFFLSEQYQEERGPGSKLTTLCTRLVERVVWLLYKMEQTLLYLMAVVLFGPYQEAVVLGHSRTKQTLEKLRRDEQCVAQAHVCRLDSDIALQSSLDEIVAFFDLLLRED
ncbi:hypothetical protein ABB37_03893 [Leptomonas pyrrhocoris]|uniref:Uncharacterized protein n=1 Tax=Leptomonas pyrrhocoris TaxID=157538 RepID=A0A0M9G3R4_LEPPY|nr:hypothetical protein ABB37_03893 [Leptomonas pyrrhocoris]KPA81549.1 hypothetical protein ABB37_03893 [Leptomonas pyrrhocoris]|eukprot:XP_015659988.1 hypothetical protein ABB37_03893 [Leptomonas pyrrhocoris]